MQPITCRKPDLASPGLICDIWRRLIIRQMIKPFYARYIETAGRMICLQKTPIFLNDPYLPKGHRHPVFKGRDYAANWRTACAQNNRQIRPAQELIADFVISTGSGLLSPPDTGGCWGSHNATDVQSFNMRPGLLCPEGLSG